MNPSLPEPRPTYQMTAGQQDLAQAVRDAVEASNNSKQLEMVAAILQAQQIAQATQQQPCQHHQPRQEFNAKKWIVIGGVVVAVGLVGALFAVAIAIGGACATGCLIVVRSMWRQYMNDKT